LRVEPGANQDENANSMRPSALWMVTLCLLSARSAHAQETKIEVGRFHLESIQGAEATAVVNNDGPDGQPAVTAVVSKIGAEFWSVELRATDINFEPGKTYEVKFQAKSTTSQFIYVVPEKMDGNQASVAEGKILQISDQWTDCTVVLRTTDTANPGRLTLSSLSANPASYSFSNVRVNETSSLPPK
jgi:Carbohydrate binding domain